MSDSILMISLFDLGIAGAVWFGCYRIYVLSLQFIGERKGLLLVLCGLTAVGSFYMIDLIVLWGYIVVADTETALQSVDYLRRELRSFFILTAALLMAIGLQKLTAALFASKEDLRQKAEQAQIQEAENRVLLTQLHQNQKIESLGTLAGGIAHDFNNILSAIINSAELLQLYIGDDEKARKNTDRIIRNGKKASDLVRQILTFSRMDSQELKPCNLAKLVAEDLDMVRSTIPTYVEIESVLDLEVDTILADRTQISQVALNLITNAYHAIGDKPGKIEVRVETCDSDMCKSNIHSSAENCIALIVKDNGHGMDPAIQQRMFDPFFTTKEVGKGTGLGLSSVQGIVEGHSGSINVDSEPDSGTTITVRFPVSSEKEEINRNQATGSGVRNKSILLVEDNKELGSLIDEHLVRQGNTVTHLTDGVSALGQFLEKSGEFDLMITDQAIPGLSGSQLAGRALELNPAIPILLMTGYSETVSEIEAKAMGIKEFILKPFSLTDLDTAIASCLDTDPAASTAEKSAPSAADPDS